MSVRFKLILFGCLLVSSFGSTQEIAPEPDVLSSPESFNRHLTRLSPKLIGATVAVMVPPGSGSGVIVSPDGLVMTAAHVTVTPGKKITVILSDGQKYPATALGVDHSTDGALIQINAKGPFPFCPFAGALDYKKGDWVIVTGHPGGPVKNRRPPVRLGRILAAGQDSGFSDPITTSATVISGDSGGPLFNLKGEVIGINSNIGRSYLTNNHVPLPCMLQQWDAMLAGDTIGKRPSRGATQQNSNQFFDEPYAGLRETFVEQLEKQASRPEAAALLARPRLLDPHHMQAMLDRWYPSGKLPKSPEELEQEQPAAEPEPRKQKAWLGIVPELLTQGSVKIRSVKPNSPAAKSGLSVGDEIVKINQVAISSLPGLVEQLAQVELEESITIELSDGRTLEVAPKAKFKRMLFPAPVAGLIQMRVTDDPKGLKNDSDSRLGLLGDVAKAIEQSNITTVVEIKRGRKTIALATVISNSGELITKASQLEKNYDDLTCSQGPVEFLAADSDSDLALLKTSPAGLNSVVWSNATPRVASLVFSAGGRKPLAGVVTQRLRVNPPTGYETAQSSSAPSVWLGVRFLKGSSAAVVGRVDVSSPADLAGVLEGDEITALDGNTTETVEALNTALRNYLIGDKVTLDIDRAGDDVSIDLILEKIPDDLATYSKSAAARDSNLVTTSKWGGALSKRRNGFPVCIYHDLLIKPNECGGPLFDLDGNAIGINIARSFRHRSLALPATEVQKRIQRLRNRAQNR